MTVEKDTLIVVAAYDDYALSDATANVPDDAVGSGAIIVDRGEDGTGSLDDYSDWVEAENGINSPRWYLTEDGGLFAERPDGVLVPKNTWAVSRGVSPDHIRLGEDGRSVQRYDATSDTWFNWAVASRFVSDLQDDQVVVGDADLLSSVGSFSSTYESVVTADADLVEATMTRTVELMDEVTVSSSVLATSVGRTSVLEELVDASAALIAAARGQRDDLEVSADASDAVLQATAGFRGTLEVSASLEGAPLQSDRTLKDTITSELAATDEVATAALRVRETFTDTLTLRTELTDEDIRRRYTDTITETVNVAEDRALAAAVASDDVTDTARVEAFMIGNASGEAWVFNTRTLAMTRYAGFDASQVASVGGRLLAGGNMGLMTYASEGGAQGYIRGGLTDFGSPQIKSLRNGYITAAGDAPITLRVRHGVGEALQSAEYRPDITGSVVPRTYRVAFARGFKGTFWGFEVVTPAGQRTTLLGLRVLPVVTSRRV